MPPQTWMGGTLTHQITRRRFEGGTCNQFDLDDERPRYGGGGVESGPGGSGTFGGWDGWLLGWLAGGLVGWESSCWAEDGKVGGGGESEFPGGSVEVVLPAANHNTHPAGLAIGPGPNDDDGIRRYGDHNG